MTHVTSCGRIVEKLDDSMRVVDIGGGANPSPRADYVIDGLSYDQRGALSKERTKKERVSRATWIELDLCAHSSWPFPDKYFDYALCTHVLEDLRDPVWVCREMCRVAKAGYIEVPSRVVEQSRGVEHPCYAGYYHHRWLVSVRDKKLQFRHKPHSLHVIPGAIVTDVGANQTINPQYATLGIEWSGSLDVDEVLCFDEQEVNRELCEFAATCYRVPGLTVPVPRPWIARLKRWVYFHRLKQQGHQRTG